MNRLLLPILIACSFALFGWGIAQFLAGLFGEKRKLQQRLESGDHRATDSASASTPSFRLHQTQKQASSLAQLPGLVSLNRQLTQAWPSLSLPMFLSIAAGAALVAGAVVGLLTGAAVLGLGAGAGAASLPFMVLSTKRSARQRVLNEQLPEALEFLARILQAGHSLTTGLQMISEELPQPLSGEFRRCYDQYSLGQPLEDALRETSVRVDSPDFGFFVTAVLIQRQTGGDLSEVLKNISGMIRQRVRLQQHVKAKTAEGRFTGYIMVAFPVIMFALSYMLNPAYAGILLKTSTGLYLLGTAAGLVFLGLIAIRKITRLKV